jgi:hypothetical protein
LCISVNCLTRKVFCWTFIFQLLRHVRSILRILWWIHWLFKRECRGPVPHGCNLHLRSYFRAWVATCVILLCDSSEGRGRMSSPVLSLSSRLVFKCKLIPIFVTWLILLQKLMCCHGACFYLDMWIQNFCGLLRGNRTLFVRITWKRKMFLFPCVASEYVWNFLRDHRTHLWIVNDQGTCL